MTLELKHGKEKCLEELRQRIRKEMADSGLGNNALARSLQFSRTALSDFLNQVREPSLKNFFILRDHFLYGYKKRQAISRYNKFRKNYVKLVKVYDVIYGNTRYLTRSMYFPRETFNNFKKDRSTNPSVSSAAGILVYFDLSIEEVVHYDDSIKAT